MDKATLAKAFNEWMAAPHRRVGAKTAADGETRAAYLVELVAKVGS